MKFIHALRNLYLALLIVLLAAASGFAQETAPSPVPETAKLESKTDGQPSAVEKTQPSQDNKANVSAQTSGTPKTDTKTDETKSNRQESLSEEEAAIIPYYNNYLKEYHLGPEDVISVDVFGQPNYSKAGITIPPTATISYPLIPGGIFVGGKTLDQIQKEIAKKLDEYIIDPQVTVTLEKVGSARYSVLGDVGAPGVKMMNRRLSVSEALMEAGGILPTGSPSKITILRQSGGGVTPIAVNLKDINAGKAENIYLAVGDQVVVPGNKIKTVNNVIDIISKVSVFRLLFGSPF